MKWFKSILGIVSIGGICFLSYTYWSVERVSEGLVYDNTESIPVRKVGVVLGTSQFTSQGRDNLFFTYRIEAAIALYQDQKIQKILVSGDNSDISYNEPLAMQEALMNRGVLKDDIILDYAGFRTLDSVVRAEQVFGQSEYTIISQPFHVKRAIFIARSRGTDVIGFSAEDISWQKSVRIRVREVIARAQAWIDIYVLDKQPKFLGEEISIPFQD